VQRSYIDEKISELLCLQSIVVPKGVLEINEHIFDGCKNLTDVLFSKHLNKIEKRLFDGCYDLRIVVISDSIKTIDEFAFSN
jgi:hypothetical protein